MFPISGNTTADTDESSVPEFEPRCRLPLFHYLHTDWYLQGPHLRHKESGEKICGHHPGYEKGTQDGELQFLPPSFSIFSLLQFSYSPISVPQDCFIVVPYIRCTFSFLTSVTPVSLLWQCTSLLDPRL